MKEAGMDTFRWCYIRKSPKRRTVAVERVLKCNHTRRVPLLMPLWVGYLITQGGHCTGTSRRNWFLVPQRSMTQSTKTFLGTRWPFRKRQLTEDGRSYQKRTSLKQPISLMYGPLSESTTSYTCEDFWISFTRWLSRIQCMLNQLNRHFSFPGRTYQEWIFSAKHVGPNSPGKLIVQ